MQLPPVLRTGLIALPLLLSAAIPAGAPALASGAAVPEPEQALGAYLAGTVAGHLGDSGIAADRLLDALAHDPGEATLLQPAFVFSTLAGRAQSLALASRVEPGLLRELVLANAAARHGDWAGAARGFAGLPASPLNDVIRPLLLSWAQQGAGQTDLALRTLAAVGASNPLAGTCALQAGMIAEVAGRGQVASSLYRTAQAMFGGTSLAQAQVLGSFLARNGQAGEAQAMMHALVQQIGVLGLAEPGLVAALDRPVAADPLQGLAHSYLAIASLLQEQDASAKEAVAFMLRFALDMQPDLTAAKLMMAEQLAPEHPDAAAALLADVDAADPLAPLVRLRSATLLAAAGQRDEARRRLEALSRAYPQRPEPAQSLGDVLSDLKLYGPAVDAYDRAIADRQRLSGTALAGNDWQLLFSRAVALDRQDQWPRAQADLEHALALSPAQPFVLNYLGYSLVERHLDLDKARLLIQRALDGKPDDGSIRDSLGWVMLRQDQVPGAVRTLERAAEQMPEDPTVNYHLGAAYWAAGRRVEAEDQWRWALVLKPEPQDAAKIRDSLHRAGIVPPPAQGAAQRAGSDSGRPPR